MSLIGIMILSACQPAQSAPVDNTAAIQAAAETMVAQTEQAKYVICPTQDSTSIKKLEPPKRGQSGWHKLHGCILKLVPATY